MIMELWIVLLLQIILSLKLYCDFIITIALILSFVIFNSFVLNFVFISSYFFLFLRSYQKRPFLVHVPEIQLPLIA
jgi:hypothetical protein